MTTEPYLITYDIECYPNFFSFTALDHQQQKFITFEVSWRKNQWPSLCQWWTYWKSHGFKMVGFNNVGYDYPVMHDAVTSVVGQVVNAETFYMTNERIINTPWNDRFSNIVPAWRRELDQVDLYLIHHFDNDARRTSLKQLEFVMRASNIEDLPYEPGVPLVETDEVAENVLKYNKWDVWQTYQFYLHSKGDFDFRNTMTQRYDRDFTNHNSTKIGKDYFIMCLQQAGIQTHEGRAPRQTWRDRIDLADCVLPYVQFHTIPFVKILEQIRSSVITETKGALKMSAQLEGFQYDFGLGGIHGSIESSSVYSDDEYVITDADVASYYPNLAIANKVYPEHLSDKFCEVYEDVYNQRKGYAKGTVENAAMKLALNGVYGDSNNKYSPFYDPKYTMTITINGQLLLCMLAEQLQMRIPGLQMIQINTDGLTVRYPRAHLQEYQNVCQWWQELTKLELEFVDYSSMHIRDVNNYIAVSVDGKKKFKGAYVHTGAHEGGELDWHQNHSALVIKKAAAAAILDGVPVRKFITEHQDPMDFMLLAKVGRKDSLELQTDIKWDDTIVFPNHTVRELQRVTRYYISKEGHKLVKKMPPLKRRTPKVQMFYPGWISKKANGFNKNLEVTNRHEYDNAITVGYVTKDGGTYEYGPVREIGIDKDWLVTPANRVDDETQYDFDYNYYITEAEKLVNGVKLPRG